MEGGAVFLDTETLAWLHGEFPGVAPELLVDHPWAETWVFTRENQQFYLKKIHASGLQRVQAAMSIARNFADVVPPVIAGNPKLAVMVVAHHGGKELKSRTENMAKVLPAYADLQVRALRRPMGSKIVPRLETVNIIDTLLEFLNPEHEWCIDNTVGADHYIGQLRARQLHGLFTHIRGLVLSHLAKAGQLPQTLNHCDLRPPNMAMRADGTLAIFDWDDALWGAVGLSLHSQFSGCLRPHVALAAQPDTLKDSQISRDRKHLDAYIGVFVQSGVIDEGTMRENLSASIVAGALNYVVGFSQNPTDNRKLNDAIGRNILKRLGSVLDVVERLALPSKSRTKMLADAYFKNHHEDRFERLQARFKIPLLDGADLNWDRL